MTQEVFRGIDAQGELREGLDLDSAALEYLAFSMGLGQLQVIESDLLSGIDAERMVDGYLSRIGSPAELKRLGIAP